MKKSEIYYKAQLLVLNASIINNEKLKMLGELMEQEKLELFREKQAEEKENENE